MKEYPEYNTDITITSVSRSLNGGTMELLKAGHAEINKVPMGEGTFKVLVSKPTISYIDDTVFTKTKVALEDSQKDITWSKVIENKVKPVFDYKYFVEKSNEEVKTIQPMVESSTKINVGVISKSGEDITDKIDFKRLKYINPEFEDFNYIGDNHSGKTDDIEFVIHAINRASSIKIKKIVNNYNSNLKGDSFIINLNSDNFETSLDLKHNETSKTMRIASNTVVDFKEVEPKEYKYNKIVVLNDKGQDVSKYYLNGTKVKVGDEENLTVVISSGFTNQNFFHNDNMSSQTFK
ncbi:MAG: hypothetical protein RSB75_04155 [Anaerovoracaceae bacterium]